MNSDLLKNKLVWAIVAIGIALIGLFYSGIYKQLPFTPLPDESKSQTQSLVEEKAVKVLSTNPETLDNGIVSPTGPIEINFNKSLVNDPARVVLDPKVDYTVELSPDHKQMRIIPKTTFGLGQNYTLTIKSGYGTDTGEKLENDLIYHFSTITYKGV